MANPERDVYSTEGTDRVMQTRQGSATAWFVGIVVALALLAIAYLVFSANSQPSNSSVTLNNTPAITTPATPTPDAVPPATPNQNAPVTPAPAIPETTTPATPAP